LEISLALVKHAYLPLRVIASKRPSNPIIKISSNIDGIRQPSNLIETDMMLYDNPKYYYDSALFLAVCLTLDS